jgi:peptide/nickel transport system permease protein
MLGIVLRRLGVAALTLLLVMVFLSQVINIVPGDPVVAALGPRATPELREAAREEMLLDQPIPVQIVDYVTRSLRGDLGRDFFSREPVRDRIVGVIPHTVALAVFGLLFGSVVGVSLGVIAARSADRLPDRLIAAGSIAALAFPAYVVGIAFLIVFVRALGWLPGVGQGSLDVPVDYVLRLLMPGTALGISLAAYIARLTRSSMLDNLNETYVRVSQAQGVAPGRVVNRYVLRASLAPTIAVLGLVFGGLLGGAIIIEIVFSRAGLGQLLFSAIQQRNFPLLRGTVLVTTVLYLVANIAADLSYRFLDPRVRRSETVS